VPLRELDRHRPKCDGRFPFRRARGFGPERRSAVGGRAWPGDPPTTPHPPEGLSAAVARPAASSIACAVSRPCDRNGTSA
jgi:hypothetical protein